MLLIAAGCEAAVDFALDDHHPDGNPASRHIHSGGGWSPVEGNGLPRFGPSGTSTAATRPWRIAATAASTTLSAGLVERVDEHGVEFVMDTYDMGASSARFTRCAQDTLLTISLYDVIILSCRLHGLVLDFMLSFEDCIPVAWPGAATETRPEADTDVGTATPLPAPAWSEPIRGINPSPTVTPTLLIPTNTPEPTERPVWTMITYRTVTGIIVDGYEHPPDTIAVIQGEDGNLRCRVDAEDHNWAPVGVGDVLTVQGIPVPVGEDVTPLLDLCRVTAWAPEQ